jgi:hypothetical protein
LNFFNQLSWCWQKAEKLVISFFLLLLIILSLVYYKERIIFTDTVDELRSMLRDGSLIVTTNRYTSIFGQFLPLAAFKLGLSLRIIVIAYSLNLILIPVAFCLISIFWFKETKTAWSILLFYTIMNVRLFYFPVSEFQIGLCFLLFYIGLYQHYLKRKLNPYVFWVLSLGFIPTILFSHPLSVPVFAAWIALQFFINEKPWKATIGIGVLAIMTYTLKSFFYNIPYDTEKKQGLERFNHFSLQYFDSRLAHEFCEAIQDDYFLIPLLFVFAVLILIHKRKYIAAFVFTTIVVGFWILVTVSFMDARYSYYTEHMYQPITFFIASMAGMYVPFLLNRRLFAGLITVILLISINHIFWGKEPMQKRLQWYNDCFTLMDKKGIKKAIVGSDKIDIGWPMEANWVTMYESLVLSSLKGPENAKTITVVWNEENSRSYLNTRDHFITLTNDYVPISELPSAYFSLDSSKYVLLSDLYPGDKIRELSYRSKR